jgi:hypothetical protein
MAHDDRPGRHRLRGARPRTAGRRRRLHPHPRLHPLLASRADSGEVLHTRQRTGRANSARGTARFVEELAARVRRAGASGELTLRADSGFWSATTTRACRRHKIHYSITVRQTTPIRQAITDIAADAWVDIVHPDGGLAEVAETRYQGDR